MAALPIWSPRVPAATRGDRRDPGEPRLGHGRVDRRDPGAVDDRPRVCRRTVQELVAATRQRLGQVAHAVDAEPREEDGVAQGSQPVVERRVPVGRRSGELTWPSQTYR